MEDEDEDRLTIDEAEDSSEKRPVLEEIIDKIKRQGGENAADFITKDIME